MTSKVVSSLSNNAQHKIKFFSMPKEYNDKCKEYNDKKVSYKLESEIESEKEK